MVKMLWSKYFNQDKEYLRVVIYVSNVLFVYLFCVVPEAGLNYTID